MRTLRGRGARAARGPAIAIGDDHARHDGRCVAVLALEPCDVLALDDAAATRVAAAMTALLDSLTEPLQLLLRTRPWGRVNEAGLDRWTAVAREHSARHIERHAPLRHHCYAVIAGTTAAEMEWRTDSITATLDAAGIRTRRCTGASLTALFEPLQQTWHLQPRQVAVGGRLARGFILRRFPGGDVGPGWLHPLLTAHLPVDIAIHINPLTGDDALSMLRRRLRDELAQQYADSDAGHLADIRSDVAVDGIETLRERLASNRSRPVQICVMALAWADDRQTLERRAHAMSTAWAATGAHATPLHLRHDAALLAALPLAHNALLQWKLSDSEAAATLLPLAQVVVDDPSGYRIGWGRRDHAPVCTDPFATAQTTNANVAVMATSGHGKSFTLSGLMLEARRRGRDVVVIDPEGEYRHIAAALGGEYADFGPAEGASLNIFATGTSAAETSSAVADLCGLLCGGLDATERAVVATAAEKCLAADGPDAVLAALLPGIAGAARVHDIVRRHCTGPSATLLSRRTSIPTPPPPFLGIGYRDLPRDLVPAVTYLVAQWIWTLVRTDRRRRHLVVDELGLLLDHADLRHLIIQLARRCRKYDASLVVATQNATDLLATPDVAVIPTNAATILLGGQRPADIAAMAAAFGLTTAQARFLETARRGEFLLLSGHRRAEITIDLPPEYGRLIAPASAS